MSEAQQLGIMLSLLARPDEAPSDTLGRLIDEHADLTNMKADMLKDIHAAWLALADSDIKAAERYLIKWVTLYDGHDVRPAEGR